MDWTRPDTRLPQSRVGGHGPYLSLRDHLGTSSEVKDRKNRKKGSVTDGWTDERTDGPTKRGVEFRSTRLKRQFLDFQENGAENAQKMRF